MTLKMTEFLQYWKLILVTDNLLILICYMTNILFYWSNYLTYYSKITFAFYVSYTKENEGYNFLTISFYYNF